MHISNVEFNLIALGDKLNMYSYRSVSINNEWSRFVATVDKNRNK